MQINNFYTFTSNTGKNKLRKIIHLQSNLKIKIIIRYHNLSQAEMGHLDALTLKVFSIGDGSGPRSVVREHWWTTSLQGVLRAAVKAASDSFLKARREGRTDVARPPRTREEAVFNHSDQSITLTPYDKTSKAW